MRLIFLHSDNRRFSRLGETRRDEAKLHLPTFLLWRHFESSSFGDLEDTHLLRVLMLDPLSSHLFFSFSLLLTTGWSLQGLVLYDLYIIFSPGGGKVPLYHTFLFGWARGLDTDFFLRIPLRRPLGTGCLITGVDWMRLAWCSVYTWIHFWRRETDWGICHGLDWKRRLFGERKALVVIVVWVEGEQVSRLKVRSCIAQLEAPETKHLAEKAMPIKTFLAIYFTFSLLALPSYSVSSHIPKVYSRSGRTVPASFLPYECPCRPL